MPTLSPTILVLEDDEPLLEAITTKLSDAGFRVLGTRTVNQALDFIANMPSIDAVWVDHYLPGKTGNEFVEAMRKDPRWRTVPVFLVTNTISPEIVNQYIRLGITKYYLKVVSSLASIVSEIALTLQTLRSEARNED